MRKSSTILYVFGFLCLLFTVVVLMTTPLSGGEKDKPGVQLKQVPITPTAPASGAEMYREYCAVCHGIDAKGNGPAAAALRLPATDLTRLTMRNGGKYPALKVQTILSGTSEHPVHGTKDMPMWGTAFRSLDGAAKGRSELRVFNLVRYLESLQK